MPYNYTIIIPHKNIPELLARCIDSIPERDDIQIIVVDDNSTDADTYLEKYPELFRPDIEFYFTKEGKGAGYARNVGLKRATGKWIMFADADDFFLPEWMSITDRYLSSDADVVQFRIDDVLSRNDCLWHNESLDYYAAGKITERDVLFSNITCWAKMINSSFIQHNNIQFEEVKSGNDVAFGFQVAVWSCRVLICPSAIYDVTYREGSLTTIRNRESSWTRYQTGKHAYAFAAEQGFQRFELPYAIEVLKAWRKFGLKDFLYFIWHERREIRRASKVQIDNKPFNFRHPYVYVFLVLLKLI